MQLFFHGQHGWWHASRARAPNDDDDDDDFAQHGGDPASMDIASVIIFFFLATALISEFLYKTFKLQNIM